MVRAKVLKESLLHAHGALAVSVEGLKVLEQIDCDERPTLPGNDARRTADLPWYTPISRTSPARCCAHRDRTGSIQGVRWGGAGTNTTITGAQYIRHQRERDTESIRLLEQVAQAAPVPAIYNNLGVEYAKTQNVEASRRAFELSKAKIAEVAAAAAKNRPLSETALKPPPVSGPGVRTESSAVPAMTIDAVSPPYEAPAEIHVIAHGTPVSGSYQVKYRPEPGTPVVMEPGAYDVLMKVASYGAGFILASNVVVREGTLTRIDPNALVGGIAVEPVSKKGFPLITKLEFVDRSSGDKRLLAQQTEKLGVTLPIAPGTYDVIGTTTYDQHVEIAGNIAVRAKEITRFDTLGQVAAIVVHAPNVKGLNMKAVYALKAGTNAIAAKVEA